MQELQSGNDWKKGGVGGDRLFPLALKLPEIRGRDNQKARFRPRARCGDGIFSCNINAISRRWYPSAGAKMANFRAPKPGNSRLRHARIAERE